MPDKIAEILQNEDGTLEIIQEEPEIEDPFPPVRHRKPISAGDPTLKAHWVFT